MFCISQNINVKFFEVFFFIVNFEDVVVFFDECKVYYFIVVVYDFNVVYERGVSMFENFDFVMIMFLMLVRILFFFLSILFGMCLQMRWIFEFMFKGGFKIIKMIFVFM